MWIKLLIVFIAGIIETFLFTGWTLAANKKQVWLSTILMITYMFTYLVILDMAFADKNSMFMIISYTIACGIGNFIRVNQEHLKGKKHVKKSS
jgi:uncharacterized protein YebE (UPF0316 family)